MFILTVEIFMITAMSSVNQAESAVVGGAQVPFICGKTLNYSLVGVFLCII